MNMRQASSGSGDSRIGHGKREGLKTSGSKVIVNEASDDTETTKGDF
jgi:hypothetical protein